MAERIKLDLSADRKQSSKNKAAEAKAKAKAKAAEAAENDGDDDDDDILDSVPDKKSSKNNLLIGAIGVIIVAVLVLAFLLFGGKRSNPQDTPIDPPAVQQQDPNIAQNEQQQQTQQQQQQQTQDYETPDGLGTQDFTQNTTMQNGNILTNPDEYVEDLYGLTTRVDYTVDRISFIADFVSYEKHRGTWGGGLELYWLDATYKGNKYVVQVPFQYYKELDNTGIVPVKMEVLSIKGSVDGENLSVISYMCLDEATLKDILKQQTKN